MGLEEAYVMPDFPKFFSEVRILMEFFRQVFHKFAPAGQFTGINLGAVQGRKTLLSIETPQKIVSVLECAKFDAPILAGIQTLYAAASRR